MTNEQLQTLSQFTNEELQNYLESNREVITVGFTIQKKELQETLLDDCDCTIEEVNRFISEYDFSNGIDYDDTFANVFQQWQELEKITL